MSDPYITSIIEMERTATISDDGLYRYRLGRRWGNGPTMCFIMLNPSTADAEVDDPTIRRCMGFARRESCGAIDVVNLFALRATKPRHLLDYPDPEGPGNWHHVIDACQRALYNVAAWGSSCPTEGGVPLISLTRDNLSYGRLVCLGVTASGDPRHPLYVKGDAPLRRFLDA